MAKSAVLATLFCALVAIGTGVWAVMSPLMPGAELAVLQDPHSGKKIVCQATLTPPDNAADAVAMCVESCQGRGYRVIDGADLVVDYNSPDAFQRARNRWMKFVPSECRG